MLTPGRQLGRVAAGDRDALQRARTTARVIASSPALQARERQAFAQIAHDLAGELGEDGLVARAVANALVGVHAALVEHVRRRLLSNADPTTIADEVRAHGERVFDLLEHGLAGYATGPEPS